MNSPGRVIPLGLMRSKTNGARMVLAIFTMAMFYTSVCTTTCAIGVCRNEVQQTAGHDCEQSSSHHSGQPGHEAPESPDCSKHAHPGVFVARSGNVSQFQLSIVGHLQLSAIEPSSTSANFCPSYLVLLSPTIRFETVEHWCGHCDSVSQALAFLKQMRAQISPTHRTLRKI